MADDVHVPVLLDEAVAALAVRPDGTYIDATFGRGGHARALLALLGPTGRLLGIDRDPAAESSAHALAESDPRFVFRRAWFSELPDVHAELALAPLDGVLLDLGISSPQIDDAARGFSLRHDGPLDMRMDPSRGESAAEFIARATVRELTEVIHDYGEERFAQSIAGAIAAARARAPIVRTRQLREVVGQAIGARTRGDWSQDSATRTFQALRLFVNRELSELAHTLPAAVPLLRAGGRLAVISFHSLEDRIVKRFLVRASQPFAGDARAARLPIATASLPAVPLTLVGRAIRPGREEVLRNPRARSAVLRVAQRTADPLPADWPHGYVDAEAA
ncbi:MAG: 16S rRNA (cytosine(1402)-N(4))-methyltransferase RsmH [Burkholderiales bacterium]|nr:16S rRNA (cytosine(1402)-N(4))-methyltransferase RsmH [Burkholderiales bacterium]